MSWTGYRLCTVVMCGSSWLFLTATSHMRLKARDRCNLRSRDRPSFTSHEKVKAEGLKESKIKDEKSTWILTWKIIHIVSSFVKICVRPTSKRFGKNVVYELDMLPSMYCSYMR